jgi:hypothetical protein
MHPAEEDLVMLYYREASENIRAHLEACPECQAAYRNLVRVLDACDDVPVPEPPAAFESRMWHRLEPRLHPHRSHSRWWVFAAAAAMLVLAFLAGRFSRTPHEVPVAISAAGRQRVLEMALSDHLERSQMVLTEFANSPDASDERQRARNLIDENRLYRQTAADHGDRALTQVLDELERVLLDVSHGTDPEEVKSRIESESLLFKLRVLESHLNRSEEHL